MDQIAGAAASWIEWQGPAGAGRRPVDRPLKIGRDPGCEICVADPSVSRQHAVVSATVGHVLVDAGRSKNGISLAGTRVPRATILPGQPFMIGATTFTVVPMSGAQPQDTRQVGPYAAPAAAANRSGLAIALVLGGILIAAIAGAGLLLLNAKGGSSSGSITITPSTYTCTNETHTIAITLPASVQATDEITIKEGTVQGAGVFDTRSVLDWGFTKRGDGSWQLSDTGSPGDLLAYGYVCAFPVSGSYTIYVLDSGGRILAQGTYTVQ
jgi:pSer/pThr/pTyr-binding forkhead associated (FHA) protein